MARREHRQGSRKGQREPARPETKSALRMPTRGSLVLATAGSIRQALISGEWPHCLPGERQLSRDLHVGRTTLRKALEVLRKEGLLRTAHGKRTRIVNSTQRPPKPDTHILAALVKGLPEEMSTLTSTRLLYLQDTLRHAGYSLEVYFAGDYIDGPNRRRLEQLILTRRADGWLLFAGNLSIQSFFQEHRLPTLLVGTPHPGITFPYIDLDYQAACRHAAGYLLARGHRRIVLLGRSLTFPGAQSSIAGFREAFANHGELAISRDLVISLPRTNRDSWKAIHAMLQRPDRPTALVCASAETALLALSSALAAGCRVPQDLSIISREDHRFLHYCEPDISAYACDHRTFNRIMTESALELVTCQQVRSPASLILPELCPGGSVAPLRTAL